MEHVRLGIPRSTPLAVQQWDGLIAINYEARKFGVKRGDRTAQAKRKCPQIVFVHVETIVKDGGRDGEGAASRVARHIQSNSKVSLERSGARSCRGSNTLRAPCPNRLCGGRHLLACVRVSATAVSSVWKEKQITSQALAVHVADVLLERCVARCWGRNGIKTTCFRRV